MGEFKFLDYEGLQAYHENLQSIIEENEQAISTALEDLDDRLQTIENKDPYSKDAIDDLLEPITSKLDNIEDFAEVNVQSDWNQTNTEADDYIKNKPTIPVVPTNVSAFTNDAGYLTQHQDISDKVSVNAQTFTDAQKLQARTNIDAVGINDIPTLPENLTYFSDDSAEGIIPVDGIRLETKTAAATINVNPDVVTVISGEVGTAAITLQVPDDNLAHVWDIMLTTGETPAVTFSTSNSGTILYPAGFRVLGGIDMEISIIGNGNKFYMRYGEFS